MHCCYRGEMVVTRILPDTARAPPLPQERPEAEKKFNLYERGNIEEDHSEDQLREAIAERRAALELRSQQRNDLNDETKNLIDAETYGQRGKEFAAKARHFSNGEKMMLNQAADDLSKASRSQATVTGAEDRQLWGAEQGGQASLQERAAIHTAQEAAREAASALSRRTVAEADAEEAEREGQRRAAVTDSLGASESLDRELGEDTKKRAWADSVRLGGLEGKLADEKKELHEQHARANTYAVAARGAEHLEDLEEKRAARASLSAAELRARAGEEERETLELKKAELADATEEKLAASAGGEDREREARVEDKLSAAKTAEARHQAEARGSEAKATSEAVRARQDSVKISEDEAGASRDEDRAKDLDAKALKAEGDLEVRETEVAADKVAVASALQEDREAEDRAERLRAKVEADTGREAAALGSAKRAAKAVEEAGRSAERAADDQKVAQERASAAAAAAEAGDKPDAITAALAPTATPPVSPWLARNYRDAMDSSVTSARDGSRRVARLRRRVSEDVSEEKSARADEDDADKRLREEKGELSKAEARRNSLEMAIKDDKARAESLEAEAKRLKSQESEAKADRAEAMEEAKVDAEDAQSDMVKAEAAQARETEDKAAAQRLQAQAEGQTEEATARARKVADAAARERRHREAAEQAALQAALDARRARSDDREASLAGTRAGSRAAEAAAASVDEALDGVSRDRTRAHERIVAARAEAERGAAETLETAAEREGAERAITERREARDQRRGILAGSLEPALEAEAEARRREASRERWLAAAHAREVSEGEREVAHADLEADQARGAEQAAITEAVQREARAATRGKFAGEAEEIAAEQRGNAKLARARAEALSLGASAAQSEAHARELASAAELGLSHSTEIRSRVLKNRAAGADLFPNEVIATHPEEKVEVPPVAEDGKAMAEKGPMVDNDPDRDVVRHETDDALKVAYRKEATASQ